MPWHVEARDGKFCVVVSEGPKKGKVAGCHASKGKAEAQKRALYANTSEVHMSAVDRLEVKLAGGKVREYRKVVNGKTVRVKEHERKQQQPGQQIKKMILDEMRKGKKGRAPLGAKVVKDLRSVLREDGMSHDKVQEAIDEMRETYRSTGDFELPKRVKARLKGDEAKRVKEELKAEFRKRKKKIANEKKVPPKKPFGGPKDGRPHPFEKK